MTATSCSSASHSGPGPNPISSSPTPLAHQHHQHFCNYVLGWYHGLRFVTLAAALLRYLVPLTGISESTTTSVSACVCALNIAFIALLALDLWHTATTLRLVLATLAAPALSIELADRTLLSTAFLAPGFSTCRAALASSAQMESWPCFYAISMFIPGCAAGFTPAFTLVLWCCLTPCVMCNDFFNHCQSLPSCTSSRPADPRQMCTPACFAAYLSGPGMATLALGVAASALQVLVQVLRTQGSTCPASSTSQQQPGSTRARTSPPPFPISIPEAPCEGTPSPAPGEAHSPPQLPFQTLVHLPFLTALGRCPALAQLQQYLLPRLSCVEVDPDVVLGLVCLPVVLYYTALASLCRLGFSPWRSKAGQTALELCPNDVYLIILSCIVLGRTAHHMQTSGLLQQVQYQLDRCVEALADVFPLHVTKRLLEEPPLPLNCCCCAATETEEQCNRNAAARLLARCGGDAVGDLLRACSLPGGPPAADVMGGRGAQRERRFWSNSTELCCTSSASAPSCYPWPNWPLSSPRGAAQRLPVLGSARSGSLSNTLRIRMMEEANLCRDVAQGHDSVTIFFSDICCFSTWAHRLPPDTVMHTLNDLFTRLDNIILHEMPSLYKIETIGDAYVVAANLLTEDPEHAATAIRFAIRAQEEAAKVLRPDREDGSSIKMRIGLHSGPVMSGVAGRLRRRFCVFGDTVNMGARTEASCPAGGIQLTASTHDLAQPYLQGQVALVERGDFQVKGADALIKMYLVEQAAQHEASSPADEDWASLE